MDTTIVIGYELFAKRLLDSRVEFQLADGQRKTETGLSRRAKNRQSTIDWQHTQQVLMDKYGQAHGFTTVERPMAEMLLEDDEGVDIEDGEDVDMADSEEPLPGGEADEGQAGAPSPGAPRSGPSSKRRNIPVATALSTILQEMKRSIPKEGGVLEVDEDGDGEADGETSGGSDLDKRPTLSFQKKGRQMLRLFFSSLGIGTGGEMIEWYNQNQDKMPTACWFVYTLGSGWFPVELLKVGKWPEMGRITLDEAHIIRNTTSIYYTAAYLVPAHEALLVTGTPQYNGTQDVRAYATLFAARSGIDKYLRVGSNLDCAAVIDKCSSSRDVVDQHFVEPRPVDDDDSKFVDQLHEWADKDLRRRQWWCLLWGHRAKITPARRTTVAGVFLSSFISLRRMKTRLRVGDKDIYPGASLPECRTRTVELSFQPSDENLRTLQHLASAAVKYMYTTLDFTERSGEKTSSQTKEEKARRRKLLRNIKDALNIREGREGSIAMALHRILTLISFDMRNYRLLFDKTVYDRDPLVKLSDDEVKKLRGISRETTQPGTASSAGRRGGKGAAGAKIRLGSEDVQKLAHLDKSGGVMWQYILCAPAGYTPVDDPVHMVSQACIASPILLEGIRRIVRSNIDGNGRVLVLIDSPFAQS